MGEKAKDVIRKIGKKYKKYDNTQFKITFNKGLYNEYTVNEVINIDLICEHCVRVYYYVSWLNTDSRVSHFDVCISNIKNIERMKDGDD